MKKSELKKLIKEEILSEFGNDSPEYVRNNIKHIVDDLERALVKASDIIFEKYGIVPGRGTENIASYKAFNRAMYTFTDTVKSQFEKIWKE